jgi:hypothetical protein
MADMWSASLQWWEEWQLHVLVLGSLGVQCFLLFSGPMRKFTVPRWFRICIMLAHRGSDPLAIYALAVVFNRHARATAAGGGSCACGGDGTSCPSALEVLCAPVLLIHLGGQEEMGAYNIEDNEMWIRHTMTLVSHVTIALYTFYKSWPTSSGNRRLWASGILLFIVGILTLSEKPWALTSAIINRLAAVSSRVHRRYQNS